MMSSTQTYFLNSTVITLKPLRHNRSILHANVKVCDIWTLKVFLDTGCDVNSFSYEVQIFRAEENVRDTPFTYRTFLKDISQVDEFIKKFQEWAQKSTDLSFYKLKFINDVAVISKPHPEFSELTCNLQISKHLDEEDYYNIGYFEMEINDGSTVPSFIQLKNGYCEKDDVTHYIRWFTQWIQHYNEEVSQGITKKRYVDNLDTFDPYLSWISYWEQF